MIFPNGRKTIGYFCESLDNSYQELLWPGVRSEAVIHGVNLLCFVGGYLDRSAYYEWETMRNHVYTFAGKESIDGFIVTGTIGSFTTEEKFQSFLSRYEDIPAVAVGPEINSMPSVRIDNRHGMRSLVRHLADVHGYRRFAYIRGPMRNTEENARFNAFLEVMTERGIAVDSDLVIDSDFSIQGGVRAADTLISRGLPCQAVVAANDNMALGAVKTLQSHGYRVPLDVAVTGFDDLAPGRDLNPPLSTVFQPIGELGKRAVGHLVTLMGGGMVPFETLEPSRMVLRRSCGCAPRSMNMELPYEKPVVVSLADVRKPVIEDVAAFLKTRGINDDILIRSQIAELLDGFMKSLESGTPAPFLQAIEARLGSEQFKLKDYDAWCETVFALQHSFIRNVRPDRPADISDLTGEAIVFLGDYFLRQRSKMVSDNTAEYRDIEAAADDITNASGMADLAAALFRQLPKLGIASAYMVLYDEKETGRLALALENGSDTLARCQAGPFPAHAILPPDTLQGADPGSFILFPLFSKEMRFGHLLLKTWAPDVHVYDAIFQYTATALRNIALIDRIRRQTEALARAHKEVEQLRETEHQYLQAVKRELELGRKIQTGFLPSHLPAPPEWEIDAAFMPASEVSGDFYDVFEVRKGVLVVAIGDVSGKHVSAALFMAILRTLIRLFSERTLAESNNIVSVVDVVNDYIVRHHRDTGIGMLYATLFTGIIDCATGTLTYVNAGHIHPVIFGAGRRLPLRPTGPAVGLDGGTVYASATETLEHGECLFGFTDGVTEARGKDGAFFSRSRLETMLAGDIRSARELVDKVRFAIQWHSTGTALFDDVTMLAVRRQ